MNNSPKTKKRSIKKNYIYGNKNFGNNVRETEIDWNGKGESIINNIINVSPSNPINISQIVDNADVKITENINPYKNNFWDIVKLFNWCDKSDCHLWINNIKTVITYNNIILYYFIEEIEKYKISLDNVLKPVFIDINDVKYNNILYHIIFKGKEFYYNIINFPDFSSYLLSEHYPVYEWMMEI